MIWVKSNCHETFLCAVGKAIQRDMLFLSFSNFTRANGEPFFKKLFRKVLLSMASHWLFENEATASSGLKSGSLEGVANRML